MTLVLDLFSITAIGAGAFFFFAGTLGLLRFPDALTEGAVAQSRVAFARGGRTG
jgi:multisubunit Na+/H+ antiporter MnhG subunit